MWNVDAQHPEWPKSFHKTRLFGGDIERVGGGFYGHMQRLRKSKTGGFAWMRKTTLLLSSPQFWALLRHVFACGQPKRGELKTRYGEKERLSLTCVAMPLRRALLGTNHLKSLLT